MTERNAQPHPKYRPPEHSTFRVAPDAIHRLWRFILDEKCAFGPAHRLMGHDEGARTAFDFRPPASLPLYRGNPWFAIIRGYRMPDRIALWRASR
jgi:hypothetical protein